VDHGDNGFVNKKAGASNHSREVKSMIRDLVQHDHLSDYRVSLEDDMVIFKNRMSVQPSKTQVRYPVLDREAYYDARLAAPRYDMYYLEQAWRDWCVESGMPELGFLARHSLLSVSRVISDGQIRDTRICAG